jgi:hypothetical protein
MHSYDFVTWRGPFSSSWIAERMKNRVMGDDQHVDFTEQGSQSEEMSIQQHLRTPVENAALIRSQLLPAVWDCLFRFGIEKVRDPSSILVVVAVVGQLRLLTGTLLVSLVSHLSYLHRLCERQRRP